MSIHTNFFNKMLASLNQQYKKRTIHAGQVRISQVYKAGLTFKNQLDLMSFIEINSNSIEYYISGPKGYKNLVMSIKQKKHLSKFRIYS